MPRKFCYNFLLATLISASFLSPTLLSMENHKLQSQKKGSKSQGIEKRQRCFACGEAIDENEKALTLTCYHRNLLHERCIRRRSIVCPECESERVRQELLEKGLIADSITIGDRTIRFPKKERGPGCFVCHQPVEEGTEAVSLNCAHRNRIHEACLEVPPPCEFCEQNIPEHQRRQQDLGYSFAANNPNNNGGNTWFGALNWPRIAAVACCLVFGVVLSKWLR